MRGPFADYPEIGGRSVLTYVEVGYVWPDGVFELYFRDRATGCRVLD